MNYGYPIGHVEPSPKTGVGLSIDKIEPEPPIGLECANCGEFLNGLAKEVKEIYFDSECETWEDEEAEGN